jgi:6-phosphogluconate dehydrogenase (decarboxylating)
MRRALIGLGRTEANLASRLMRGGHRIVAFDWYARAVTLGRKLWYEKLPLVSCPIAEVASGE